MSRKLKSILCVLTVCLMLGTQACNTVAIIDTTISAIETILPIILNLVGVPVPVGLKVQTWLGDATTAVNTVDTILAAGGPADQVSLKVTVAITGVLGQVPEIKALPLPAEVIADVGTIAGDLQTILKQYGNPTTTTGAVTSNARVTSTKNIHFGDDDQRKLTSYRGRCQTVLAKLRAAR